MMKLRNVKGFILGTDYAYHFEQKHLQLHLYLVSLESQKPVCLLLQNQGCWMLHLLCSLQKHYQAYGAKHKPHQCEDMY